ncbi:2,3-diaminopropionate biosynthesis protein SbnA [Actinomycetospora termitidis]|uniref:2,3-diaminopropionate biosynthesis protein SbnA n=1 Tax=Actinomycetospora termitidis TaxID=3053470 RepID=A0ABT7MFX6_9PSEU|nr:2,3-diaminopropionate biosynthesis protein SbnA [Actinomycetospora sp. Odt1-22]MDL5159571.1 2,3-diaminopropionate biosynthesis protein SbnA [Actinomycetospora sp. Odt1-22]
MPVIRAPQEFNTDDLFVDLRELLGRRLFLKCEGFNFAGSVKLKAAAAMIDAAESEGLLDRDSILVESSSGNLGVALAMIAANRGYRFLCVTDLRVNEATRSLMEALGTEVHTIVEPSKDNGLLGARLDHIAALQAADERVVWLNQYANHANWMAHYRTTAPSIARRFPELSVLVVGAGTTGTLMGCARYFHEHHPEVRLVAVDAVGSVSFGGAPAPRLIPGLGMSVPPPQLDTAYVDDIIHVAEVDTVRTCRTLAAHGFLFGGSTGTVVKGALTWLDAHATRSTTAVAIAPDLGERYLSTIYARTWVEDNYGVDDDRGALPAQVAGALR